MERMGRLVRGLLPAAHEPDRDRSGDPVETLHPIDRGGVGLPDHQGRTGDPSDLAPEARTGQGSHPGVLPGLRALEDAGPVDASMRAWAMPRAPCWWSWPRSRAATWFCRFAARLDQPDGDQAPAPERVVRLRCVTAPDEAQKVLLHRLGLTLPQRLRRIDEVVQM